ncbi:MAG: hypothetical protein NC187_06085 [Candidatus Amulumruptor caecigallinarius]|nr:hypothetical protein [Candidatus Amulumruptor caecigallinarius]MCM1397039.1 hypothetical protein [Candidatus Amulumruptor caecigallinarius]MCM1454025.1 hypothetical protein [bacterium]
MRFYSLNKRFSLSSLLLMLCLMAMPVLTACGDDDEPDVPTVPGASAELNAALVGTWVYDHGNHQHVYVFNPDGTGMYYTTDYPEDADMFTSFQVINNVLMILWEGDNEWDDEGILLNITNNTFTICYDPDDPTDVEVYTRIG